MDQEERETTSYSDPHRELNSFLDEITREGMKVTNQWKVMWTTALKYAWSAQLEQLKSRDIHESWHYITVNRIYPLMFQNIAKLAKNHPKVCTMPWSDEKEEVSEFAEKWAGVLQYIWESPYELHMRLKLIIGLLDAALFGYMVGKCYWDDRVKYDVEQETYEGNVRHTFVHPATFWVDPHAESISEAENCGTKRRVRMEWAIKRWPKYEEAIEKEAFTSSDPDYSIGDLVYQNQREDAIEGAKAVSWTEIVGLILKRYRDESSGELEQESTQKFVWVEEIYWQDYATEHIKIEDKTPLETLTTQGRVRVEQESGMILDAETGEEFADEWPTQVTKEYDRPKFPNGRFVLRIGRTILNPEEKDQQYSESRWPFTVMVYHPLPHMWQGCNAIEMAKNNQDILNLTISALVHHVEASAEPERIIEANSLAKDRRGKTRRLRNIFGLGKTIVMAKGKIDAVRNMEYPQLSASVMALAQVLKQDIDDQMFMQEVARGSSSKAGQLSATEAARLDTNSHDYTAMQAIFLDGFIDNTLTLVAEIVQRYYQPDRITRMVDDDRQKSSIMLTQSMLDVRFDVNIVPGSTLPIDEARKKEDYLTAYKLLENPMPNPLLPDTLRVLNITNRKKVLANHRGIMLFRQFVAMSQALQQVPPEQVQELLAKVPGLQPLYQLLVQASQLQMPGM